MTTYVFDGTFTGLLTAVFDAYALRHREVALYTNREYQPALFTAAHEVKPDEAKAGRVWKGLEKKLGKQECHRFYTVYLSEDTNAFRHLFAYACLLFDKGAGHQSDYGNIHVIAVEGYARKVSRERHRMTAFVRFKKASNGLYFAVIEPDFNVLPLIAGHFKDRYADQRWLIYDRRRHRGIYYDLDRICEVEPGLKNAASQAVAVQAEIIPDETDELYTTLWQDYFRSACISERKNLKLHLRHVPGRYWKYLPEKGI